MPVGRGTLGRILNVLGEPVDENGPVGEFIGLGSTSTEFEGVGCLLLALKHLSATHQDTDSWECP